MRGSTKKNSAHSARSIVLIERAKLNQIIEKCRRGSKTDIDDVLGLLTSTVELTVRKNVDFYLGGVTNPEGLARLEH